MTGTAGLRIVPSSTNRLANARRGLQYRALEVWQHEDVEQLCARSATKGVETLP